MTDLPELIAELKWCYENGSGGPRTKAALKWALDAAEEEERDREDAEEMKL
jgi:hypothetical protein